MVPNVLTLQSHLETAVRMRNRTVLGSMGIVQSPKGGYVDVGDTVVVDGATILADLITELFARAVPEGTWRNGAPLRSTKKLGLP